MKETCEETFFRELTDCEILSSQKKVNVINEASNQGGSREVCFYRVIKLQDRLH